MRLIDADELRHSHCVECTLYPDKCLEKDCDWGSIYHIDHAPTVDAIPVKWIEQYGRENWYDFGTQYNAITEMLKAWRKKNGQTD